MVGAVIITHGSLGQVMVAEAERTLGPQCEVKVINNDKLSLEQMVEHVQANLPAAPTILFVDFCGGSPYVACQTARRKLTQCALISGVNLPMLYSFFTKRDKLPFGELVETVQADAIRGIQVAVDKC